MKRRLGSQIENENESRRRALPSHGVMGSQMKWVLNGRQLRSKQNIKTTANRGVLQYGFSWPCTGYCWSNVCSVFSEVGGGHTLKTGMGVQEDFVLDTEVNGKPVQCVKDGGDVLVLPDPHQYPGSAVLFH
ncbi:hypothetical protein XENOCAPTIV_003236 [Xenoophorus captivus]|uniref:Uncharacterized protein n=1 Tax=Xenoophorus captivus TaxID=1517983 RepID=A0ABV0S4Y7_9TELE